MNKICFSLLLLITLCFGADNPSKFHADTVKNQNIDFFNPGIKKSEEASQEKSDFVPYTKSQYIFTSFTNEIPKTSYTHQLIPLQIKATVSAKFNQINISSTKEEIGTLYQTHLPWEKIDEHNYQKTVYFQPKVQTDFIPALKVRFEMEDGLEDISYLPSQKIDIIDINDDGGKFINLFAKSLHVNNFKTSRFDEHSLIMVIEFKTAKANSDDIYFKQFEKQGIDSKSGSFLDETIFYFLIFDEDLKNIEFSYFNLENNNFEPIKLPVVISEDDLSTHIGLNPKKSVFELYKDIGMGAIALLFLVVFIFRKRYFYLIIALLFAGILIYKQISFTKLMLKDNTKVRILPTEKSTIFFTTQNPTEAEKLNTIKYYIKVLLPNGKIGWVKEDDIIKN